LMHPIERLRYVARASGVDPALLVRETAAALAAVVRVEPAGLVPACRRLIERHLTTAPVWWLAARVLTAADPVEEAWAAAAEIEDDQTANVLAGALPDEATITIVGWPDTTAGALRRRGDLEVLIGDAAGEGAALSRRLVDSGMDAAVIPDAGLAAAVVVSDVVLIEALAAGPSGVLATAGSHAAAAVATHAGLPVWAVVAVGRILPERLWDALLSRVDDGDEEPWDRAVELVPASLFTSVVGPDGVAAAAEGLTRATCPVAPELLRPAG
jgi:hypothetical protein